MSAIKLAVGSKNPVKVNAARRAFAASGAVPDYLRWRWTLAYPTWGLLGEGSSYNMRWAGVRLTGEAQAEQ